MSITDELRKSINDVPWVRHDDGVIAHIPKNTLFAIADRIDRLCWSECDKAYSKGVCDGIDADKNAMDYVKLPVDADGVPIRIGDELDVGFVARIVITDDEWPPYLYAYKETPHILLQHFCSEVSHYHEPTVEDVLREFADEVQRCCDTEDTIAEYAAKLRLAGEAE